jgi:hypothetical protein
MKAMTLGLSPISTSSNMKRSLRPRSASSTVLYCVLHDAEVQQDCSRQAADKHQQLKLKHVPQAKG